MSLLVDKIIDKIRQVNNSGNIVVLIKVHPHSFRKLLQDRRSSEFLYEHKIDIRQRSLFGYPFEVVDSVKSVEIITNKKGSEVIF